MKMWTATALLWVGLATGAQAQGFVPMQNDPAVMQAVNQMAGTLGGICQSGNPPACQMYNYVMQNANAMMGASNACQAGDQMGCQYYARYYQQMDQDYGTFTRQMGGMASQQVPGGGGYNPLGNTHQERMQAIQNFGAQNTQNWQNHMNQVDQNHQQFLNYLNQ